MNKIKIFKIWVEIDEYDINEEQNLDEDFCNVIVYFCDGSRIGVNVWSENFFLNSVNNLDWINEQVAILPDLVVRKYDALSIRQAVIKLISEHNWLEGRGFPVKDRF